MNQTKRFLNNNLVILLGCRDFQNGLKTICAPILDTSIFPHPKKYRLQICFVQLESANCMVIQAKPSLIACSLLVLLSFTGCVQRRLQIRSQPEGALVSVDRQPVGNTPLSVPFTYYGTREIQLEKDGFKTIRVEENIKPPWYERFPVSFFSNHFAGREIRDERLFDFQMQAKDPVNETILIDRANDLRNDIQRGTLTAPIGR